MQKIIHLTDTHLRACGKDVLGMDPLARLETVLRSIAENHRDAACCVVSGDIADAGEVEAYEIARDRFAKLSLPVLMILGNHDKRQAFRSVFNNAPSDNNGFVQHTHEIATHKLILLDTLDEIRPGQGLLCRDRLAWLADELPRTANKPTIIFMHHPPLGIGLHWFNSMLLANGDELMRLLKAHPQVVHLAFGHVHVNTSGIWRALSFSGSRGTCHKILADPVAAFADYVDHGPAYDVLLAGTDIVCVHNIDPAGPNRLIAREYATADQRGEFISLRNKPIDRWM